MTRDGYPLRYDVFDGNRADVTTVEEMVGTIEERYGKAGWVWVMDLGMVSEDILSPSGRDGRAIRAADAGVGSTAPELAGAGKSRLS